MYNILRKHVARLLTDRMGKCEILDDKIICYVNEKNIKNQGKYNFLHIRLSFETYF